MPQTIPRMITAGLTTEEEDQLIELLDKVIGAKLYLSARVFEPLTQIIVGATVEMVVLRTHEGRRQVLLTTRPDGDINWANQWHFPGTFFRQSDSSLASAFARLEKQEFGVPLIEPQFVYLDIAVPDGQRGCELLLIHTASVVDSLNLQGKWFDVEALPDDLVASQRDIIREVDRRVAS